MTTLTHRSNHFRRLIMVTVISAAAVGVMGLKADDAFAATCGAGFTLSGATCSVSFAETGSTQQIVVPPGVTTLTIDANGAAGGMSGDKNSSPGFGGSLGATVPVTPGHTLSILVGAAGSLSSGSSGGGGFGGGGSGGSGVSGGGGGGSFVFDLSSSSLLAAAGGGGGAGVHGTSAVPGGNGSAATGFPGTNAIPTAKGGSGGDGTNGSFGGAGGIGTCPGGSGTGPATSPSALGVGGSAVSTCGSTAGAGGGGGGGWYGGGAGAEASTAGGGGGGGSGYVTAGSSVFTAVSGAVNGNGSVTLAYSQFSPTITSATSATFVVGSLGSFSVTGTGFPTPTFAESGALPSGVALSANGLLSGTPGASSGGAYPITVTASNGVGGAATQSFVLTVDQAPAITSPATTSFVVGTAGSFNVVATGVPTATYSESGTLPTGVSLSSGGFLAGAPGAGTGGIYAITITASNGISPVATQSFVLVVDQPAAITSDADATLTVGIQSTVTITTTGFPTPALTETGSLPHGMSFTDNGDGTAAVSGIPAVDAGGTYSLTLMASNGVGALAAQSLTLTVFAAPAITSVANATFIVGTSGSFSLTATGTPTPSFFEVGALPLGVTLSSAGVLAGTPGALTGGTYVVTINATNGINPVATQTFSLTVEQAPLITSAANTTFTTGTPGSFTVTTTGFLLSALMETGPLPSGVTFTDNGDGTGTLSGTPAAGSGGSYPITLTASNFVNPAAVQSFTLTVNQSPAITSAATATFVAGAPNTFVVTATGHPAPALIETGTLPHGVTFTDNNDGTATLTGSPGAVGYYDLTLLATNGVGALATQSLTLIVTELPTFTSATSTLMAVGNPGSFTVTTTGFPTSALVVAGPLPNGVTFTDDGNGTGIFRGTPAALSGDTYPILISANNGVTPVVNQNFTLNVQQAPVITSSATATFIAGAAGSFTVTTSAFPTSSLLATGPLPIGVTFTDNANGTATFSGTPAALSGGAYPLILTASNGISPVATQDFTLAVVEAPVITSVNKTIFTVGGIGSDQLTATGTPAPAFTETGTLPIGVSLSATGLLSGTPAASTAGIYPVTVTAANGVGSNATQTFTLTVTQPGACTSGASTTVTSVDHDNITAGVPMTPFYVTSCSNSPVALTVSRLPVGLRPVAKGVGRTLISGTAAAHAHGVYIATVKARVAGKLVATQTFTLTVNHAAVLASAAKYTATTGTSFSVPFTTTLSYPTASLSTISALPPGVTFVDNGNGTGALQGSPGASTGGLYGITVAATNSVATVSRDFTLIIDQPPEITSPSSLVMKAATAMTPFQVTTTGYPEPHVAATGLPPGLSLVGAIISGAPKATDAGSYAVTLTAHSDAGSVTQTLTVTVNPN